jgi:hypothetical protein
MKIDLSILKSLFFKNWSYIAIIILLVFLFKSCQGSEKLGIANNQLKNDVELLGKDAQKYVDIANSYRDTVTLLKQQKQKVKDSIVYVEKKEEKDLKVVSTLTTKGIANYFQDSYKIPVKITQYGVAVPDTLGKAIITDLIKGQGYREQLKFTKQLLSVEEKSGVAKDSTIVNQTKAIAKINEAIVKQETVIKNTEKSLRKEKNKKTFWQVVSGAVIAGASYLIITK